MPEAAFYTSDVSHPLLGKTSLALGVTLALLAVPYFVPSLERFRVATVPWVRADDAAQREATANADAPPAHAMQLTQGETTLRASKNEATVTNALPEGPTQKALDAQALAKTKGSLAVEDATGRALDAFYGALAKTRAKTPGAVTRIEHYGDSVITSDYVSGTMRRKMQAELGDGWRG